MTLKQTTLAGTVVPVIKSEAERGGRAACHAQTVPVRVGKGMTFKKGALTGTMVPIGKYQLNNETTLPVRGRPLTLVCVLRLASIRRAICRDHGPVACDEFWAVGVACSDAATVRPSMDRSHLIVSASPFLWKKGR